MLPLEAWVDANAGWIGFAGLALALLFGVLGIYFWRRPHRSKMLGCERLSGYNLVQVPANQGDKHPLKLVYGSERVAAPYISVFRVGNLGDEEVRPTDFDVPITIEFTEGKLLAWEPIDKSIPGLEPVFTFNTQYPNRITLQPLLLNGHEWIDIQCVSDGNPGNPQVQSRVAGETKPIVGMMDRSDKIRRRLAWSSSLVGVAVFAVSGIYLFTNTPVEDAWMLPLIGFGAGYFVGQIPLLKHMEMQKHRGWAKKQT